MRSSPSAWTSSTPPASRPVQRLRRGGESGDVDSAAGWRGDWAENDRIRRAGTAVVIGACLRAAVRLLVQQSVAMLHCVADDCPQTEDDPIAGYGVFGIGRGHGGCRHRVAARWPAGSRRAVCRPRHRARRAVGPRSRAAGLPRAGRRPRLAVTGPRRRLRRRPADGSRIGAAPRRVHRQRRTAALAGSIRSRRGPRRSAAACDWWCRTAAILPRFE